MTSSAASARSIGLQRAHEAVVLGRLVDPALAAHAGGVDEAQRPVVGLDDRVDRVAGRAGQVVHDRAVVADEPVEQRRLADVGAADDRDREDAVAVVAVAAGSRPRLRPRGGSAATSASSRSPLSPAVERRDVYGSPRPSRANSQRVDLAPLVVDLVDDDDHRLPRPLQDSRDAGVLVGDAGVDVDDEHDQTSASRIARSACSLTFAASAGSSAVSPASPGASQPPVSTTRNAPAVPLGDELLAVARDAGLLLARSRRGARRCGSRASTCRRWAGRRSRRRAGTRLPTSWCDHRRQRPSRATRRRSATTSTGRGSVASAMPSRKRPLREHDVGQQVAIVRRARRRARRRRRRRSAGRSRRCCRRRTRFGTGEQPYGAPARRAASASSGSSTGAPQLAGDERRSTAGLASSPRWRSRVSVRQRGRAVARRPARRRPRRRSPSARRRPSTVVAGGSAARTSVSNVRAMPMPFSCCAKPS